MAVDVKPLSKIFNRVFKHRVERLNHDLLYMADMAGSHYETGWIGDIKTDDQMWDGIRHYLERGASVDARDCIGRSPLVILCENKHPGAAMKLIGEGADVNVATEGGMTALIYAAINVEPDLMRCLIDHGADLNARTDKGTGPLDFVLYNAEYKAKQRADRPDCGRECLKLLLDHGMTLDEEQKKHIFKDAPSLAPAAPGIQAALDITAAAEKQDAEKMRELLAANVPPDAAAAFGGEPALQRVIASHGDAAMTGLLIAAGADIGTPFPSSGYTPLQEAARHGRKDAFLKLLDAGADPTATCAINGKKDMTLADIARAGPGPGMAEFVEEVLQARAAPPPDMVLTHEIKIEKPFRLRAHSPPKAA